MFFFYQFLTFILYPIFVVLIIFRVFLGKEDKKRFQEKILIERTKIFDKKKTVIWFHGASLGEIRSVLPVIDKILKENKQIRIIITSITLSSGNIIKNKYGKNKRIKHQYFPFDNIFLVQKFLNKWNPNLVALIDSEIWPNFIIEIKKRKIPLALINGRITEKTYNRWKIISTFAQQIFSSFDICMAASKNSFKNLKQLQANNVKFQGNLKFISYKEKTDKLKKKTIKYFKNKKVWCAASTHPSEEIFCLKTHILLKKKYKNLLTIIVPRHIDRIENIIKESKKFNLNIKILNNKSNINNHAEVVLVNSFGLLNEFYNHCQSVFMGKSMLKSLKFVGGQNPIEAARQGCKIYHGPYVYNFFEIYDYLKNNGIAKQVNSSEKLAIEIAKNFKSPNKVNKKIIKKINQYGNTVLKNLLLEIKRLLKNEVI